MKKLLIVESPTKARTIKKYLKRIDVISSKGHIKDLPKSKLGVDIDNGFKPTYINIRGKGGVIKDLKNKAKKADIVYIGTDPDREGEAIAYHINQIIDNGKEIKRVLFYEITPEKVKEALNNPTEIDMNKVDAHKARRVLDRLVGYLTSPVLWKTIRSGLSAGRVQTVALRILAEREKEIKNFIPEKYYEIGIMWKNTKWELVDSRGRVIRFRTRTEAEKMMEKIKKLQPVVQKIDEKEKKKSPPPPLKTSTLQQEAYNRYKFTSARTMRIAQRLYEGVDIGTTTTGLITYMRTDSLRLSEDFTKKAKDFILSRFGESYYPGTVRVFKDGKMVQGAHEAIRPTYTEYTPESIKSYLSDEEFKIYDIIFRRAIASQMSESIYKVKDVWIKVDGEVFFRKTGLKRIFDGWEKFYWREENQEEMPEVHLNEAVKDFKIELYEKETKPPPRFTESTLIKTLEKHGIGRPSTYAKIVSTLYNRNYVKREKNSLVVTELGMKVSKLMVELFPDIFEINFTREMEEELDRVEEGREKWQNVVSHLYLPFSRKLEEVNVNIGEIRDSLMERTGEKCPKCGGDIVVRWSRKGKYYACENYPKTCDYIKLEKTGEKCPQCGADLVYREGRFGRFIACSRYPECKYTRPVTADFKCPLCGSQVYILRGRRGQFYRCSNKECSFISRYPVVDVKCPECGTNMVEKKKEYQCPRCKTRLKK